MRIQILKLDDMNTIVIKKSPSDNFFVTTSDSFIITTFNLSALIKFMLFKGIINPKLLEGVLEEYYNANS